MKFLAFGTAAAFALTSVSPAQAATIIGFQPLAIANSVPITYTESGYTIQSNNTRETVSGFISNSTLTIQKYIGANDTGIPAVNFARSTSFTLTGGTFTFDGLAAYFGTLNGVSSSFTVIGSLLGAQLYSMEFNGAGGAVQSNNSFRDFASGSNAVFDKLVFTSGATGGTIILDDIKLAAATIPTPDPVLPPVTAGVPEPATWAMMMLGFGAMGFAMRRKQAVTRIRFA